MAEQYPERYEILKRLAYLEADVQQMKDNADRDYSQMQIYYEKAKEMYSEKEQDMEMDMLDRMMQELREEGGYKPDYIERIGGGKKRSDRNDYFGVGNFDDSAGSYIADSKYNL